MERFGIFELLDALSSLPREGGRTAEQDGKNGSPEAGTSSPSAPSGRQEESAPPGREEAPYPAPQAAPDAAVRSVPDAAARPAPAALESFLKRHDALSRRAEKK